MLAASKALCLSYLLIAFKPLINQIGGGESSYRPMRVVVAGVIGGTASKLSGGKFVNGAVTGAFIQLFNAETALSKRKATIRSDSEDELKQKMGYEKGKTLVFSGKRKLAHTPGMAQQPNRDAMDQEVLHEDIFWFDEVGSLHTIGYTTTGTFNSFSQGWTVKDYLFSSPMYVADGAVDIYSMLTNMPGSQTVIGLDSVGMPISTSIPWDGNSYNLTTHNCQMFVTSARKLFSGL
ncbi:hypothetical protein KJI95_04045 [Shewanella sp. JM162201]|uniref:Uncharacterized protein n=1 Tax=Shewanella jiangmenensis TaxID=2837387 RepID=A0ABS5V1P2_9GAMM|nr:hypothetical protein [Shewanella jiangmenensis]MBT1443696.1 hypothetical protein [Shewanella jiangmenensis]